MPDGLTPDGRGGWRRRDCAAERPVIGLRGAGPSDPSGGGDGAAPPVFGTAAVDAGLVLAAGVATLLAADASPAGLGSGWSTSGRLGTDAGRAARDGWPVPGRDKPPIDGGASNRRTAGPRSRRRRRPWPSPPSGPIGAGCR